MKFIKYLLALCFTVALFLPLHAVSQQGLERSYVQLTYRQATPGLAAEGRDMVDTWVRPLYEELVRRGHIQGWYSWEPRYKSEHSTYTSIGAVVTNDLAALDDLWDGPFAELFEQVHPRGSVQEFLAMNQRLTSVVKQELWTQDPQSIIPPEVSSFAAVNFYRYEQPFDIARDSLIRDAWMPWQRGRIQRGVSDGWAHYRRRYPLDSGDSYNATDVVYFNNFEQVLGANVGQDIWESVRRDNSSLGDMRRRLDSFREIKKVELWEMVDYVQAPQ